MPLWHSIQTEPNIELEIQRKSTEVHLPYLSPFAIVFVHGRWWFDVKQHGLIRFTFWTKMLFLLIFKKIVGPRPFYGATGFPYLDLVWAYPWALKPVWFYNQHYCLLACFGWSWRSCLMLHLPFPPRGCTLYKQLNKGVHRRLTFWTSLMPADEGRQSANTVRILWTLLLCRNTFCNRLFKDTVYNRLD